jgi:alpha-mannosidase
MPGFLRWVLNGFYMPVLSLSDSIAHLRALTQESVQTLWHWGLAKLSLEEARSGWEKWAIAPLNARDHVAWARGRQRIWLGQRVIVPTALQGYPLVGFELRLSLTWWAESARIFVNGALVQEGDLFDHSARVLLSASVAPGEAIEVLIELVSPGHDEGALVKAICLYERTDERADEGGEFSPEPGFVADELAVLQAYVAQFLPERLGEVAERVAGIDWDGMGNGARFDRSLARVRRELLPLGAEIKGRSIQLVGHAHLDLAWLWDVADTWEAAERTFQSVLQLQQDFPELTFCHTSPALFAWIEENRPELFAAIREQVAAERWEIVAGLWVEPELNLIGGESLARQVLYGQRYVRERFGAVSRVAWLPDSFGFCWQLPQVLKLGGVEYFVTQKLRWNDTTRFPYDVFGWNAPDRSQIFSHHSAPIGEGVDPVKMAKYAVEWETKTGLRRSLWLPGVGDHGGGPTRDMLQVARRWGRSPFFPALEFGTVEDFLSQTEQQFERLDHLELPIWNEDLYLEFHRGCYTTHADQKRRNRRCEELLFEAELFASIATLLADAVYPQAEIEAAWKQVLFNQFHDILPGSAIAEVYGDADEFWRDAEEMGERIRAGALGAIAAQVDLKSPFGETAQPIAVFNALNWERSGVVEMEVPGGNWQVFDWDGKAVPTAKKSGVFEKPDCWVRFWAKDIPAIGYRCFWLCPGAELPLETEPSGSVLENQYLRVAIDATTGNLSNVFDKLNHREVLRGAGNELQAFRDEGQYWDAWNIDPGYADHPLPVEFVRLYPGIWNDLEQVIWVERRVGQSLFRQAYVLQSDSPVLRIDTEVDWQERHVLVKAAFPVNLEVDFATYEIPFGAIQRTTRRESDHQKAQWEVPALRWADLGNGEYGVSLLNDCKYGYDAEPGRLRLTLLRGTEWPNPGADLGMHRFSYGLYAYSGDWRSAQTVRRGYEFNQPLRGVKICRSGGELSGGQLPMVGQFFELPGENAIVSAFKRSEDDCDRWVLRFYECQGERGEMTFGKSADCLLSRCLELENPQGVDLLETQLALDSDEILPWKIVTLLISQLGK